MKISSVLELTIDEAREALIDFYADTVVKDRLTVREYIATGQPINGYNSKFVPDITGMYDVAIADKMGELNLAESIALENKVDKVVVNVGNNKLVVVFDASC